MTQGTLERIIKLSLPAAVLVAVGGYYLSARTLVDHDALVMCEVARRVVQGERLYWDVSCRSPPRTSLRRSRKIHRAIS